MKILYLYILVLISFLIYSCNRIKDNVGNENETDIEKIMKTPYIGDTLIGKFNGIDIDTLISEPIGTVKGFNYKWRIYTKNGTVKDLILENETIDVRFVREGDLDGDGTDEWGFMHKWETSNWTLYDLYTFNEGEWQRMIEPLRIYKFHFENNDRYVNLAYEDIIQKSNKEGFIKARFSDLRNDDFVIVDTLINVNSLAKKEQVQELTDYGEPFPIDVIKECIYYNGGKEPQKNIHIKDLFGEWEFERDIKVNLKINPDMTYTETREGYLMDEDNISNPYKKVKSGKFTYKDNILTLLDYNSKQELHPTDWKKYKNPLNRELMVFSLNRDTLSLYESGVGNNTYLRFKKQ